MSIKMSESAERGLNRDYERQRAIKMERMSEIQRTYKWNTPYKQSVDKSNKTGEITLKKTSEEKISQEKHISSPKKSSVVSVSAVAKLIADEADIKASELDVYQDSGSYDKSEEAVDSANPINISDRDDVAVSKETEFIREPVNDSDYSVDKDYSIKLLESIYSRL
ncbi:MAG: hypothetical protein N3B21_08805 [Clostridia bacterium]|nr:hypothetical protein [Clostridia bacterium]